MFLVILYPPQVIQGFGVEDYQTHGAEKRWKQDHMKR